MEAKRLLNYFVYQGNNNDCGFAALKMLLALVNRSGTFLRLKKPAKRENYTFSDLIEIGARYKLNLVAFRNNVKDLSLIKTPCIALINENHAVLVRKITKSLVQINDPYIGPIKMNKNDFLEKWNGLSLEIQSFEKTKYVRNRSHILSPIIKLLYFLLSAIGVASLLAGLSLVKQGSHVIYPILLFSLFAVCELVDNWYLIKVIKYFDIKYLPIFFNNQKSINADQYKEYTLFKESYFTLDMKFLTSIFLISIISIVLIFNEPHNIIAILLLLTLCCLLKFIFSKRDFESLNYINSEENKLFKDGGDVKKITELSNKSCSYAFRLSTRRTIVIFFIIIMSLLLMIISKEISVNYIIFHFGLYFILSVNFNNILDLDTTVNEYKKRKEHFIDKCDL